jgi:hypothetical protein
VLTQDYLLALQSPRAKRHACATHTGVTTHGRLFGSNLHKISISQDLDVTKNFRKVSSEVSSFQATRALSGVQTAVRAIGWVPMARTASD